jgi:hypothetical protein
MKQFMIVAKVDDATFAKFADTYTEAKSTAMNIECGLGGYTEIYSREDTEGGREYRFLES